MDEAGIPHCAEGLTIYYPWDYWEQVLDHFRAATLEVMLPPRGQAFHLREPHLDYCISDVRARGITFSVDVSHGIAWVTWPTDADMERARRVIHSRPPEMELPL